jgi:hypothetical protein
MTESETIFESVLQGKRIPYDKIPETASRTPDYKINIGFTDSYWEVKELEENPTEKEIIKNIELNHQEAYSVDSSRIVNSIKSASDQFKKYGVASYPCVVVLYDSREFFIKDFAFSGYVQTAMYGSAEYIESPNGELVEVKRYSGLLTSRKNHISAIAILYKHTKNLVFFHNRNASHSLCENKMLSKFDEHYRFENTDKGMVWKKI